MAATARSATYRWDYTVCTTLPYAACWSGDRVVRNLRVCPGETGRRVVAAWADAMSDRGIPLALLSETEYRCLCERQN